MNNGNTPNENSESVNNQQKQENIYTKFYRNYAQERLSDSENKVSFLNKITAIKGNNITQEIKNDILEFISKNDEFEGEIDIDKISIPSIKNKLVHEVIFLQNKRQELRSLFLNEYNISSSEYSTKIDGLVAHLSEKDILKLISGENERRKFIENELEWTDLPKKRELNDFIEKYNLSDRIVSKLESLSSDEKEDFESILSYQPGIDLNSQINSAKNFHLFLEGLISHGVFHDDEVIEIVQTFIPIISLKQANNFGFIPDLKTYKKILIESATEGLDDDKIIDLADNLNEDEILISSKYYADLLSKAEAIYKDVTFSKAGESFSKGLDNQIQDLENIERENGPQSLDLFQKELNNLDKSTSPDYKNENFVKGSYISLKLKNKDSTEIQEIFFQIKEDGNSDEEDKKFKVLLEFKGKNGIYDSNASSNSDSYNTYKGLLNYIKNGQPNKGITIESFDVLTNDQFKNELKNGKIKEDNLSTDFKTTQDIEAQKKIIHNELITEAINEGLLNVDNLNEEAEIDFLNNNQEYSTKFEKRVEEISKFNYEYTKTKLDTLDSDGKEFDFVKGTTFSSRDGSTFVIKNINKTEVLEGGNTQGYIEVESYNGYTDLVDFETFFTVFRDTDCKRNANSISFDQTFNYIKNNIKGWGRFNFVDGKIKSKEESEQNMDFNYLIASNGKSFIDNYDLIKINKISGDNVTVELGKCSEGKKDRDKGKTFYTTETEYLTIPVGTLQAWIKVSELEPKSTELENIIEDNIESVERKGSAISRWFDMLSIEDVLSGGKLVVNGIEEILKEGSDEKAARFANSIWLPKDIKDGLQARADGAGRKRMDEFIEKLENLDSGPATSMIEEWLLNKDTPESQKEAAMIFMVKKYGTLYTKKALTKYKGRFLWYEALGGRIGDELYNDVKFNANKSDINFTEEDLVYRLINKQCKGSLKPKRRGKLYKELEAIMGGGKNDEREKGKKDAAKKRNVEDRIDFAIEELEGGSFPNAMGALEEIIGKGADGDITVLNKVSFVMLFSGAAYNFPQDICDKFKNFGANGMPVMFNWFIANTSKIDLFNQTVLEVSKDLSNDLGGKYKDMYIEAKEMFGKQKIGGNEPDKIKEANNFFDKYGSDLTRIMSSLSTGKTDTIAVYEKHIKNNKDNNTVYKQYSDSFDAYSGMTEFGKDDDLLADAFTADTGPGYGGLSGINMYKVTLQNLQRHQSSGYRNQKAGPMFWREIERQFNAYVNNENYQKMGKQDEQNKNIEEDLRGFLAGMLNIYGQSEGGLRKTWETPTSEFYNTFKKWGIKADDLGGFSYNDLLDEDNEEVNKLLVKYRKNILGGSLSSDVFVIEETQSAVNNTLNT